MEARIETELNRTRERGTIVFVHSHRYFGFIKNDNDEEMFFHAKGLLNVSFEDLREGNTVKYYVATIRGRTKAIAIEVIE